MASHLPSAPPLSPPDGPPSFVRNLARLPPAMIDQVLDNLPIARVLQILCHGTQSLKDSVFNHQQYGHLFGSPHRAAPVLKLYCLYRDICWFRHLPLSKQSSYMSNIYHEYPRSLLGRVQLELMETILGELNLTILDKELLSAHSWHPCPDLDQNEVESLKARWEWIKESKVALNAAKARQISMAADIIADYPGRLRLKKPLDPSQDGPRPNTQHIADGFRGAAKRVLKDRRVIHNSPVHCYKGVDCIELVPYDKYLWLFLDTIREYPPEDEDQLQNVEGLLDKLTMHGSLGKQFRYPDKIATSIDVVNNGLFKVFTGSPLLFVPRIDWDRISWPVRAAKPIFFIDTQPHPSTFPEELHRCACRKVMTYDEREYEWLRAFLEVVTWMEDNLLEEGRAVFAQ